MSKTTRFHSETVIECRGYTLRPHRRPLVMGVLNVTPDSFSDGGTHYAKDDACHRAFEMVEEGADIIDIGGESTRPGAADVGAEEELERVMPVIEAVAGEVPVPISIDTRRARVARAALEAGCHMVNDVSACRDPEMPGVVRSFAAPVVIMHMKGEPRTMQADPSYDDVVSEIRIFLRERAEFLRQKGIEGDKIIIDPGIGFGKRFRDNLDLLADIESLKSLGYPLLIGASRKRFLGELLCSEPHERLAGSLAVAARCYADGVAIIRVHDVKETVGFLTVLDATAHPEDYSAAW